MYRSLMLVTLVTFSVSFLPGCGGARGMTHESVATARDDDSPIASDVVYLTVYGMSCPLCANNVDAMLLDVPGVTDVNVDMGTGRATVQLDGHTPVSRRQLAGAIDRSGFSLRRIDVPVAAP